VFPIWLRSTVEMSSHPSEPHKVTKKRRKAGERLMDTSMRESGAGSVEAGCRTRLVV
jgi:hypothetical protein